MLKIFNFPDLGLLFVRVVFGICVLMHGIPKIQKGIGGVENLLIKNGLPEFLAYGIFIGEIIAPILIILGIFTRLNSVIMIILCSFILYLVKSPFGLNNFGGFNSEIVILYLGISVLLLFSGSGKVAIKRD